jgi:hypothetical protein
LKSSVWAGFLTYSKYFKKKKALQARVQSEQAAKVGMHAVSHFS